MEAEGGETNEGNESAEPTNEATEEPTSEPKEEQSAEPSPSPTPTKTTEPAPTKTAEPSPSPTPTKTTEPAPTKTAEPSPSPTKTQAGYTLAQVAQKNSQSACWVAIDGMVYDLTDWIRQHPGGRGAILSLCGTDGTSSFNAQHGGRAGPSAALDRYVLGPLTN
jgi:cytochrome b involved in lipid metabolism